VFLLLTVLLASFSSASFQSSCKAAQYSQQTIQHVITQLIIKLFTQILISKPLVRFCICLNHAYC